VVQKSIKKLPQEQRYNGSRQWAEDTLRMRPACGKKKLETLKRGKPPTKSRAAPQKQSTTQQGKKSQAVFGKYHFNKPLKIRC